MRKYGCSQYKGNKWFILEWMNIILFFVTVGVRADLIKSLADVEDPVLADQ